MTSIFVITARNMAMFLKFSQIYFTDTQNTYSLLNVKLNLVKGSVTIRVTTDSQLQVISGGLGELLAEPWRTVERTARAVKTTPLSVPQWVVLVRFY